MKATDLKPIGQGDLCTIHSGTLSGEPVIVKIAQDKANNDLVQSETAILRGFYPARQPDTKFFRYFCKLLDSGMEGDKAYNVVALARDVGVKTGPVEYVSLNDVLRAYPRGIDFRDAAWMFKRALVALGFIHEHGLIHGNVTPPHVLVHPLGHGGKLIDWSYAVSHRAHNPSVPKPKVSARPTMWARLLDEEDEAQTILGDPLPPPSHVRAITPAFDLYYPPEIFNKRVPTPATDIYTLTKTFIVLLGGNALTNYIPSEVPRAIRELFGTCLHEDPTKRPSNAWDVHDHFDRLLQDAVGKPIYRPFVMPAV